MGDNLVFAPGEHGWQNWDIAGLRTEEVEFLRGVKLMVPAVVAKLITFKTPVRVLWTCLQTFGLVVAGGKFNETVVFVACLVLKIRNVALAAALSGS